MESNETLKLVDMYNQQFGENPPMLKTVEYSDPLYQDMILEAIMENEKLDINQVADTFDKIGYDLVDIDEKDSPIDDVISDINKRR